MRLEQLSVRVEKGNQGTIDQIAWNLNVDVVWGVSD